MTRIETVKKLLRLGALPMAEIKLVMGGDMTALAAEINAAMAMNELSWSNHANGGPRLVMLPAGVSLLMLPDAPPATKSASHGAFGAA